MNSEIHIILKDQNPFTQGNCFERIVRDIIESHRYEVSSNVNYTGMELDLTARHKDRPNESLYVECKAKNKVSSSEILTFESKVRLKRANFGYFIRTKELDHQAKGLVDEFNADKRYEHLTFFEPNKVISLLQDSGKITVITESLENVTKQILAVTYFGDYYIFIRKDSLGALPSSFFLFNAVNGQLISDEDIIEKLKNSLPEIKELKIELFFSSEQNLTQNVTTEIESVSEVQESENWFDYLPASTNHIVGRDQIRSDVFNFLTKALNRETKRRVFYLTGKSGWGKSSLIADIRGRCRNKYYKNKFYTLAIDSRSALSSNFVALAFERLIKNAIKDGFIKKTLFNKELVFTSTYDLLNSESITEILNYLKSHNKSLILIFDQFEDIFRKEDLFKTFYKFLLDVTDLQASLIIGFSWKTEILIPSENKAYHLWQQAKEQAQPFMISAFGSKEINGILKQLEGSIGKIEIELKRRLVESSQSFPWLTKKLCIHIYDQIKAGKEKTDLIDENLNIEQLFKSDLEKLEPIEIQGIKYIAQRASDGVFFEASEVDDKISENVINSLRDKRLIIRSGLNYNIYWDIFRDYLVTGQVPRIGESYIIRSSVNSCLEIFLTFNKKHQLTSTDIKNKLKKSITKEAIENSLIDLRSIGLIRKIEKQEKYVVSNNEIEISAVYFKKYMAEKFKNYSIFHQISELTPPITNETIINVFKTNFKGYSFKDSTWRIYANYLINWITHTDLKIKSQIEIPTKGGGRKISFYKNLESNIAKASLRNTPKNLLVAIKKLKDGIDISKLKSGLLNDLAVLGFITLKKGEFHFTELGIKIKSENFVVILLKQAYNIPKIKITTDYIINKNKIISAREFLKDNPNIFDKKLKEKSKIIYAGYLLNWGKFIIEKATLHNTRYK
jgi:hypothetical protein